MAMVIDLEKMYDVYGRKVVDAVYSKYSSVNDPVDSNYYERFIELLDLKVNNPYCSGKEYFKILYGDRFEWFWYTHRKKNL